MTPVNDDFDDLLRRALHAVADGIEPADSGLARIRQRTRAPWLVRQTSLMLTECVDFARLIVIRLEPWLTSAAATAVRLGSRVPGMARVSAAGRPARHGPAHAGPARARPGLGWLRPAVAVAATVLIAAAGLIGLSQLHQNLVLSLFGGTSHPASMRPGSPGASQGPTPPGTTAPGPAGSGKHTGSHRASPKTSCRPGATTKPSPTPSADPKPSASGTQGTLPAVLPTSAVTPPAVTPPAATAPATTPPPLITTSAGATVTPGPPASTPPSPCGQTTPPATAASTPATMP